MKPGGQSHGRRLLVVETNSSAGTRRVMSAVLPLLSKACDTVVFVGFKRRCAEMETLQTDVKCVPFGDANYPAGFWSKVRDRAVGRSGSLTSFLRRVADAHQLNAVFTPWMFDQEFYSLSLPTGAMLMDLAWHEFPDSFEQPRAELDRRFQTWLDGADVVLPISHATARKLERDFPRRAARSVVVPHGSTHRRAAGERVKGSVFYPASLHPHKNHLTLMKACVAVPEVSKLVFCGPGTESLVTGTGLPDWAGSAREAALELGDRLESLGTISAEELEVQFNSCHLLALPSRNEGFGLPLLEGLEHGCQILASDIEPFREQCELFGAGDTVSLLPATDEEAWRAKLSRALNGPILTESQEAVRARCAKWTWEDAVRVYIDELFRGTMKHG